MKKLNYSYLLLFSLTITFHSIAQPDLLSTTSRPPSTNNGSNNLLTATYSPVFINFLSATVNETSGLVFFNGQLWTHNDGGNPNKIYQIDTAKGTVLRTLTISNAPNTDWESITQDDANLYIGDFGNNYGNRKDLSILKILKSDLIKDSVQAEFIKFSYPDQSSFLSLSENHNFDCEAFFVSNDSIHLFSKNWANLWTKHYVLPKDTGTYQAVLADSFNVDGLITDASINDKGHIVLLGYKKISTYDYSCFIWIFYGYPNQYYFNGNKQRVEIGKAIVVGQTEGIILKNDDSGWFSSEKISSGPFTIPPLLHYFNFHSFFSVSSLNEEYPDHNNSRFTVYPNRFDGQLTVDNGMKSESEYLMSNIFGQIVLKGKLYEGINLINTEKLGKGIYILTSRGHSARLIKH